MLKKRKLREVPSSPARPELDRSVVLSEAQNPAFELGLALCWGKSLCLRASFIAAIRVGRLREGSKLVFAMYFANLLPQQSRLLLFIILSED